MSIVKALEDGSVEIRLMKDPTDGAARVAVLPEPSMKQLAEIHTIVVAADDALPKPDLLGEDPTPADVAKVTEVLRERTIQQYSEGSPHGAALLAIIKLLTGAELTPDDLPGAAMNPATCKDLLGAFQAPLGG